MFARALAALKRFFLGLPEPDLTPSFAPPKPPKFNAGDQIICPNPQCGRLIATAERDIYGHEQIRSFTFAWTDGLEGAGRDFRCGTCHSWIGRKRRGATQLHTQDGWK